MRYLTSFLLLFSALLLSAQEAMKYPLLEHFTNTRCPICANRNPGFHDLRMDYGTDVNHISFHPKYPYSTCEFYQANKEGNQSRADYYNISGTPTVYLDGEEGSGSDLVSMQAIDNAINMSSYFEIGVTEERTGDMVDVTINLTTRGDLPDNASYRLFVAAVEAEVNYNAPNGEQMHYNVFREFVSPIEGVSISPPADGESVEYTYQYQLKNEWVANQMYALAFIQNDDNNTIENSGTAATTTTSVIDTEGERELTVYPNPASDKLYTNNVVESWSLYDLQGRLIRTDNNTNIIEVADVGSGVYFIRLYMPSGEWTTQKILVE
jgi:hypothetical protein